MKKKKKKRKHLLRIFRNLLPYTEKKNLFILRMDYIIDYRIIIYVDCLNCV